MNTKGKIFSSIAILGSAVFTMVLTAGTGLFETLGLFKATSAKQTTIVLDKNNAYANGDTRKEILTTFGENPINFDYSGCAVLSNGHANISSGGTIVNPYLITSEHEFNNKITGITSIYANFTKSSDSADLQFRTSFTGDPNWSEYASLTSGVAFDVSVAEPNYIELKAVNGTISLTSVTYNFTCTPKSHSGVPAYPISLAVTDAKQNNYFIGETFSSFVGNGGMSVKANQSSGTQTTLPSDKYSYKVFNSNNQEVTGAFTAAGTYRVELMSSSLGNYSYNITVGSHPVTSITVSPSEASLVLNTEETTVQLTASVSPSDATDKTYTWSSENTAVATVNSSGLVTAAGSGTTNIYATANDGSGVFGTCEVNVSTYTPKRYKLVHNETDLVLNEIYVIGARSYKAAMSNQNGNWRASADCDFEDENYEYMFAGDGITEFILGNGDIDGTYSFQDSSTLRYLYAGSNADCYLKSGQNLQAPSSWTIEILEDDIARVVSQGDTSYDKMQYNSDDDRFEARDVIFEENDGEVQLFRLVTEVINVESIALDKTEITIAPGNTEKLTANVLPSNATDKRVYWESSDESIATVENGVVTGVAEGGPVTITASTVDGGYSATCAVYVEDVDVTGVSLNKNAANLSAGGSTTLVATVEPENATNKNVTWSSDNETVATVNQAGIVTTHQAGTAAITVTTQEGGYKATCSFRVTNVEPYSVTIGNASGEDLPSQIEVGSSLNLTATIEPSNATIKTVSWSSSDSSIATINESGVLNARSEGTVTITVLTDLGNVSNTYTVEVVAAGSIAVQKTDNIMFTDRYWNAQVNGLESNWTGGTVNGYTPGQGLQVTTGYSGVKATSPTSYSNVTKVAIQYCTNTSKGSGSVEVSVGDTSMGTCYTEGSGTNLRTMEFVPNRASRAKFNGYVSFTVNCSQNSVYIASCSVTCVTGGGTETVVNVDGISVNPSTASLIVGEHQQLTATVSPIDATNDNYTWSSNNNSVATVSSSGYVSAVSAGNAIITATTEDGGFTATCNVTVTAATVHVSSVSLNPTSLTLKVDQSSKLAATVLPSDASNKSLTWKSSNTSIAAVSSDGTVSGVSAGTATITVTSVDGNKTATCSVKVTSSEQSSTGEFVINTSNATDVYGIDSVENIGGFDITFNQVGTSYTSGYMQFKRNQGYIENEDPIYGLYSLLIDCGNKSFSGTLYSGTDPDNLTHSQTINGSGSYSIQAGDCYFKVASGDGTYYIISITVSYSTEPIDPTSISLPTTKEMSVGENYTVPVTIAPSNANQHKGVEWSIISGSNYVNVSTTGVITAIAPGTAVVQATLNEISPTKSAQITITVNERQADKWTWLIYMCGADLESDYASSNRGYATSDLNEIYSIRSKLPDNMNIVIETGGAKAWSSTFSNVVNASKLSRFHLTSSGYVSDGYLNKANMGSQSTLQSFVQWGLETYPADNVGLIFWNHGGAMDGVCFDENYSDDSLTTNEISGALSSAISKSGYQKGKLEVVGYDACLMAVQDYAGMTAATCNNMVCSEESESGSGWDYDTWLKVNISNINSSDCTNLTCKSICDSFLSEQGSNSDQTLSHIDLTQWGAYQTAFENFASAVNSYIGSDSSKWSTFKNTVNKAQKYGKYDDQDYLSYNNGYVYDIFDIGDAMNKLKSQYSGQSSITNAITAVQSAYSNLVHYEKHGTKAGNSTGLALVLGISGINRVNTCYASGMTTLTTWRSFAEKWWNK